MHLIFSVSPTHIQSSNTSLRRRAHTRAFWHRRYFISSPNGLVGSGTSPLPSFYAIFVGFLRNSMSTIGTTCRLRSLKAAPATLATLDGIIIRGFTNYCVKIILLCLSVRKCTAPCTYKIHLPRYVRIEQPLQVSKPCIRSITVLFRPNCPT